MEENTKKTLDEILEKVLAEKGQVEDIKKDFHRTKL